MNWDDVRIFLAVARSGQILAAARRLGLNHATVSRRVSALEDTIGATLFNRQTTGTSLTSEGARFLERAERMEEEAIAARSAVTARDDAISGALRIGAPDGFGVAWLAGKLGKLCDLHQALSVELVPVPRSFSLSRREADIAITVERPDEGRLVAAKLVDYHIGLYASREYAKLNGLPQSPEELTAHPLIGYVPDLIIDPVLDYAGEFHAGWAPRYAVSSALGQVAAVRAGQGIGMLHAFIARAHEDLVPVRAIAPIRRAYWIVYHESLRPVARVQAAVRFIQNEIATDRKIFVD